MEQLEITVEGAAAQDLFFIERAVPEAKVVEKPAPAGSSTSYGLPGLVEAVILFTAKAAVKAAVAGAVAWIIQNRKSGRMTIRRLTGPDGTVEESRTFEWTDQASGEDMVSKVLTWISGLTHEGL